MADLFGASGDNEEWSEQMNLGFKKIAGNFTIINILNISINISKS